MAEMADHFGDGAGAGQGNELADANRARVLDLLEKAESIERFPHVT